MTRLALLQRLKELQQMPAFQKRDITTISALLSNDALADHVRVCEDTVGEPTLPAPHNGRSGSQGGAAQARRA
ncbi:MULTISPECIES: hypothetical protein [Phyllobacteriaceae]|uniref:hypothetical protein n=1 Tax=Phyllobacteriaceae TaxID=69277 RepID=UPI002ACA0AAF|nr:hypothetical protein [Chelativorans sp. M5D2P16]MDZ5696029.1 hypothetical protein [Chelativorans sp. M5D2P16]